MTKKDELEGFHWFGEQKSRKSNFYRGGKARKKKKGVKGGSVARFIKRSSMKTAKGISKRQKRNMAKVPKKIKLLMFLGLIAFVSIGGVYGLGWAFGTIAVTVVIFLCILYLWKYLRHKGRGKSNPIGENLYRALKVMDSTAKWYNDEEEANRELVSCLKTQGINAVYHPRLPNGREIDAKVGNVLIECKLSPDTAEVDRLFGQLSDYTRYSNEVNIVIYGELDKDARKRIESEIKSRYRNKVFLIYLDNPRRQRAFKQFYPSGGL